MKEIIAGADAIGKRLDQWLSTELGQDLSRNRIQALIADGRVTVNGAPIRETKYKLRENMVVTIKLDQMQSTKPQAENISLDILYEDDDILVINKPAGLVVHPGSGNMTGTLVNALIYHCGNNLSQIGGELRPGIVHRLDKNTSGVLVIAKNDDAHQHLSAQFADHGLTGDLQRAYVSLVWGLPERPQGTIETYLGRSNRDRTKQTVVKEDREDARYAVTHYTVLEPFAAKEDATALASVVECQLETGRTHQIRVHMAYKGTPIIGDSDYGGAFKTKANKLPEPLKQAVLNFPRQALHARLLAFAHPADERLMRFETPLPDDLQNLIDQFRQNQRH